MSHEAVHIGRLSQQNYLEFQSVFRGLGEIDMCSGCYSAALF